MSSRPGTVSKILWHFTGGPVWDSDKQKQGKDLKPASAGYNALKSILASKELRLGSYQEIVKVILPKKRKFNLKTKKFEILENYPEIIKSRPVCCVADIPSQHLAYHANRYGRIAIGFHRHSIVKAGFNPVMYTLEHTDLLNHIYRGYSAVDDVDPWDAKNELEELEQDVNDLFEGNGVRETVDISSVDSALFYIEQAKDIIEESYSRFLAYIKTFEEGEFDTIYCEREWRSIKLFKFTVDDIAMIALPREQGKFNFYADFLAATDLPRSVSIVAWEDLIEH